MTRVGRWVSEHVVMLVALLVLAVANGVTFMTQPADSGFWMVKEYFNLSVRDVMVPRERVFAIPGAFVSCAVAGSRWCRRSPGRLRARYCGGC